MIVFNLSCDNNHQFEGWFASTADYDSQKEAKLLSCPICGKTTDAGYRPFCSRRCADIDLGRWLTGSYVIPGEALEEDEAAVTLPEEGADEPPRRKPH